MRNLTQSDFIALWETGRSLHPLDQGILALQAAFPEMQSVVADWPLGRRNRALAELHFAAFGSALRGWTACRGCAERLESEIDGRNLEKNLALDSEACVMVNGHRYRLPTSRDLAAVAREPDADTAARLLLQQCSTAHELPESAFDEEQMEAVGESMAAADPLAEIRLGLDCPNCGVHFEESVDLPSFLWAEMEARAKRALMEVHTLASAYGWSQAEILSLTSARRQLYVEIVRA